MGEKIPGLVTNKRVKQGKGRDAVTLAKFQQKLEMQSEPMGQAIYFSLFMEWKLSQVASFYWAR